MMDTETVFRYIQNDPELWKRWHDAKTNHDRTKLMVEVAYKLGQESVSKTKGSFRDEVSDSMYPKGWR